MKDDEKDVMEKLLEIMASLEAREDSSDLIDGSWIEFYDDIEV